MGLSSARLTYSIAFSFGIFPDRLKAFRHSYPQLHLASTMSGSSSSSTTSSRLPDTGPLLGSAYLTSQSLIPPASPSELNASLCLNISLFKNTLKKYRALDDAITTRLNRDQALHRELGGNTEEGQQRNCLRIWRDIIGMSNDTLLPAFTVDITMHCVKKTLKCYSSCLQSHGTAEKQSSDTVSPQSMIA